MQVVIDIDETCWDWLRNGFPDEDDGEYAIKAIANGIPLPKGHGRLIDAGEYIDVLNNAQIEGLNTYKGLGRAKELLIDAPTIIEADKENEK